MNVVILWSFLRLDGVNLSIKTIIRKKIKSPKELCLYSSYKDTMFFFNEIESSIFISERYLEIDFTKLENMTAAAALYLVSVVTKSQNCCPNKILYPDQVIKFLLPKGQRKNDLFLATGLWDFVKPGGEKKLDKIWTERKNSFQTGNKPEKQYPEMLEWFNDLGFGGVPRKLSSAVQEAYLNIKQHAYDSEGCHEFLYSRWWQYAYYKEATDQVIFLLLDRGIGIPKTVPSNIFRHMNDQSKINEAMTEGWSSTKRPGRGRGSANIQRPVNITDNSDTLLIMSGKGRYVYDSKGNVIQESIPSTFGGTLIEWALSL